MTHSVKMSKASPFRMDGIEISVSFPRNRSKVYLVQISTLDLAMFTIAPSFELLNPEI